MSSPLEVWLAKHHPDVLGQWACIMGGKNPQKVVKITELFDPSNDDVDIYSLETLIDDISWFVGAESGEIYVDVNEILEKIDRGDINYDGEEELDNFSIDAVSLNLSFVQNKSRDWSYRKGWQIIDNKPPIVSKRKK